MEKVKDKKMVKVMFGQDFAVTGELVEKNDKLLKIKDDKGNIFEINLHKVLYVKAYKEWKKK